MTSLPFSTKLSARAVLYDPPVTAARNMDESRPHSASNERDMPNVTSKTKRQLTIHATGQRKQKYKYIIIENGQMQRAETSSKAGNGLSFASPPPHLPREEVSSYIYASAEAQLKLAYDVPRRRSWTPCHGAAAAVVDQDTNKKQQAKRISTNKMKVRMRLIVFRHSSSISAADSRIHMQALKRLLPVLFATPSFVFIFAIAASTNISHEVSPAPPPTPPDHHREFMSDRSTDVVVSPKGGQSSLLLSHSGARVQRTLFAQFLAAYCRLFLKRSTPSQSLSASLRF